MQHSTLFQLSLPKPITTASVINVPDLTTIHIRGKIIVAQFDTKPVIYTYMCITTKWIDNTDVAAFPA